MINICDADWASDASDHKSVSGYVTTMAGSAISWSSKKQTSVALSTAEAEYIATTCFKSFLVLFLGGKTPACCGVLTETSLRAQHSIDGHLHPLRFACNHIKLQGGEAT
jgi:hypothetical protein